MAWEEIWRWLSLLAIPLISGLVGWGTNVLAIKMTFYPVEYVGIPPFGWQGIIPAKARKMAVKSVDMLTNKLLNVQEEFGKLDPDRVAAAMLPELQTIARRVLDEAIEAQMGRLWTNAPLPIRQRLYRAVADELPDVVVSMMDEVREHIEELLDIKALVIDKLTKDKTLTNEIFLRVGKAEFRFIERSGFYFGFLFGLPQAVISYFYTPWWLLPVAGLVVGYATNALALRLIFQPLYPRRILGFTFQGLFLKRQPEVADEYSAVVTSKILTTENMLEFVVRGPASDRLRDILARHVTLTSREILEQSRPLQFVTPQERVDAINNIATFRFMQELPLAVRHMFGYAETTLDLRGVLSGKMKSLTPEEFEGFLHPVFQEDEATLIAVGAVLGGLAGVVQYFLLFFEF